MTSDPVTGLWEPPQAYDSGPHPGPDGEGGSVVGHGAEPTARRRQPGRRGLRDPAGARRVQAAKVRLHNGPPGLAARIFLEHPLRRHLVQSKLAFATAALAAGAIALLAIPGGVSASHGGTTPGRLTSSDPVGSDRQDTISFAGGGSINPGIDVGSAAWSPDGSRAAFISSGADVFTTRYNVNGDAWNVAVSHPNTFRDRSHPTWSSDGNLIYWSEKDSTSGLYEITSAPSAARIDDSTKLARITPASDGMDYTRPDGGPDGTVVFQRQVDSFGMPFGIPDVMEYVPGVGVKELFASGYSPSISPDGARIAFCRQDGNYDQLYVANLDGANAVELTTDATEKSNPTWSPDGSTIAYNSSPDGPGPNSSIMTIPAAGGTPTLTSLKGFPAYEPSSKNHIIRLQGSDRFGTAGAISKSMWATATNSGDVRAHASAVVLSRSDTFADAVSGAALAAAKQGPLLLTSPATLTTATANEISRVLGQSNMAKTVYLLGGTGAISQTIEDELAARYTVKRLSGANRFQTSISIANEIDTSPSYVLAATGANFPDALSAGTAAGAYDYPGSTQTAVVVLTDDAKLPTDTKTYLDTWAAKPSAQALIGVGGQAVAATNKYAPVALGGANRYETAIFVAQVMFGEGNVAGVTIGANWPDALAGGALLGTLGGPLLLTTGTGPVFDETQWEIGNLAGSVDTAYVFGGGVPMSNDAQIGALISGPGSYDETTNPQPSTVGQEKTAPNRTQTEFGTGTAHNLPTATQIRHSARNLPNG